MIRLALALLLAVSLAGCASSMYAGIDEYQISPLVDASGAVTGCCTLDVKSGKQASSVSASFTKTGDNYVITLNELQVQAFKGQAIASATVSNVAAAVSNAAVSAVKVLH